jgi:hypothetical protein
MDFLHDEFYVAIVDYFEVVPGPAAQERVNKLLAWWNRCAHISFFFLIILMNFSSGRKIFGRTTGTSDTASRSGSSISKMAAQRAAREEAGRVAAVAPLAA